MRTRRVPFVVLTSIVVSTICFAQPGRGGSQWPTALGDAQRTSWVRSDDKISLPTMSAPGFELQWKTKLDNQPRGLQGLVQGVTANGVTLFVPMSLVTGSSNNLYAIDNDIGYVVWQRRFEAPLPAVTSGCAGGISSGPTRIVRLEPAVGAAPSGPARPSVGYRSLLGEPGQGVPLEGPAARGTVPPPGARQGGAGRGAAPSNPSNAPPAAPARGGPPPDRIPGAPKPAEGSAFGFLQRPSGVAYVVSSDGMLHVVGLASGKDLQRPAPFVPPNSRWSSPIAVNTTLYTATSGGCGAAPSAVWAIDLDSEAKPVVSWKTNGGDVVGAVAFAPDGTLLAAIGAGRTSGEGQANAIVALDPKTLQVKDWFTQSNTEFVTGPTILRHNDKDIVAAATRDGRVLLLDATALGGADHATPLHVAKPLLGGGGSVSANALATWQSWILVPVAGRVAGESAASNGPISDGAVVALKLIGEGRTLATEPGWVSQNLSTPATPLIVNGVVFTLATGTPAASGDRGMPAVLHAYDGATGKRLWSSEKAMTTFASPGSLWTGLGQIYVGTHDGTLYAFGFEDERR
jgi:outer membrane protein assembly factor BamB